MGSWGFVRLIRPVNSVVAAVAVLLGYLIAEGTLAPRALVLVPVVFLITAAGNGINDYFDREIDRVNRPLRPIPSGTVAPSAALAFSCTLFVIGNLIAFLTGNILLLAIAAFNSVLLVLYAARLKGLPLVGNGSVAYLAASIFLFGGAAAGTSGVIANLPVAAITFLATLSREILKDAEDISGDASGGARTLPMVLGVRHSALLALLFACGAILLSALPLFPWYGALYLGAIAPADILILAGGILGLRCADADCIRSSKATLFLKAGMFVAVFVFLAFAILAE
ncbi:MAG: geranylgeranylglycerol-phosphate geranylgeranyltransferase [Methanomicrobiaceae archaeon]|nr:geranylgeranylglycerol-phosphate geranylgeranyltransferase [Methanomicrobiaceae archaeon]